MLKLSKNAKKPGMHLESRGKSRRKEAHNQDRKRSYRKHDAEEHTALTKETNKNCNERLKQYIHTVMLG